MPPAFRSIRLPTYDYRSAGAYFVTICSHMRQMLFAGDDPREAIIDAWNQIPVHFPHSSTDQFVVMPNHVHGIIWITDERAVVAQHAAPLRPFRAQTPRVLPRSLGAIVRSFKSASTKRINELRGSPGAPVWQRNYYERIIRDEDELYRVRKYILDNPAKWQFDRENPNRAIDIAHDKQWAWLEGESSSVVAQHAAPPRHAAQP